MQVLCRTLCVLGLDGVPNSHGSRHISTGDVEAAGGEPGDARCRRMAGVLLANGRVIDGSEEDGFAGLRECIVS